MANEYLSESPVELAMRFADLGGSSVMSKTLADEVRRLRGLLIGEDEAAIEYADMHLAMYRAMGFLDDADAIAMQSTMLKWVQDIWTESQENAKALLAARAELRKEVGGLHARLSASRTERDKLHGDKVRMLSAIDGALASLRPYMETRGAPFPLANALVIKEHEFTESSDVPGSCAMCGWPERSQVHREADAVPTQATEGSVSTVLNGMLENAEDERAAQADEAIEKQLDLADYHRDQEDRVPSVQDLEEHDESIQAELDNREYEEPL